LRARVGHEITMLAILYELKELFVMGYLCNHYQQRIELFIDYSVLEVRQLYIDF
jgi:hypothetical protein